MPDRPRGVIPSTALAILSLLLAACAGRPGAAPPAGAASEAGAATAAVTGGASDRAFLRFAADGASRLALTRWSAIAGDPSSGLPEEPEEKAARLDALLRSAAPPVGCFGCDAGPGRFFEQWGFDVFDLQYQVDLGGDELDAHVLQLDQEADLDGVRALLEDRGFEAQTAGGGQLWSAPADIAQEWFQVEPAMANLGVLAADRVLVASHDPEDVRTVLEHATTGDDGGVRGEALAALGPATSAILSPPCPPVNMTFVTLGDTGGTPDPDLLAQAAAEHMAVIAPLDSYAALALGWRGGAQEATGKVAFLYDSAAAAASDLEDRAAIARDGVTLDHEPIAETRFTVADARADSRAVVLDVLPVDSFSRLAAAEQRQDVIWAACG